MDNQTSKQQALFELSSAIAALKNPQCHVDLHADDELVLNVKLQELIKEFEVLKGANSD